MDKWNLVEQNIEKNRCEMVKTLREFVSIASVVSAADGDMPYGKTVHDAFMFMLNKAEEEGFDILNVDNYGGHIEFGGVTLNESGEIVETSDETMGIIGHVDVVPEGSDWDYEPYNGIVENGKLYGRGALDDKGPVIASFYAMKAIKDAGLMPAKKVRLVLGLDEETNWEGMKYYLSRVKPPDFGFTPDSEFPAIYGEMGVLFFDLVRKIEKGRETGLELRSLKGGAAANMVADYARAVVRDENRDNYKIIKEKAARFREEKGFKVNCKGMGRSLEITVQGLAAHGSRPSAGVNAVSQMMELLGTLDFSNDDVADFINFYNTYIGYELDGKSIGAYLEDKQSGKLIFNVGKVDIDTDYASLTVNIRYPVTKTADEVYEGMRPILNKYNFGLVKKKREEPIYLSDDDPMIVLLMDVYRRHTGDKCDPVVIGGATYARLFDRCVAFGCRFPETVDVAHQKNEFIDLDELFNATKIYADAIYQLAEVK